MNNDLQALITALEAGYKPLPLDAGRELTIESLEATMRVVTYLDMPTRVVDGRRQPVLNIHDRFYEFMHDGKRWVQVPSVMTQKYPTIKYMFRTFRIERKRLTDYQVRKANRKLNHYLEFLLKEDENARFVDSDRGTDAERMHE